VPVADGNSSGAENATGTYHCRFTTPHFAIGSASQRRTRTTDSKRGRNPRGWKADLRYVPSSENRPHGATLGDRLERFCNGTRFRYVFR
jgi:hypothetical protein